jgi:hypothetical protein
MLKEKEYKKSKSKHQDNHPREMSEFFEDSKSPLKKMKQIIDDRKKAPQT